MALIKFDTSLEWKQAIVHSLSDFTNPPKDLPVTTRKHRRITTFTLGGTNNLSSSLLSTFNRHQRAYFDNNSSLKDLASCPPYGLLRRIFKPVVIRYLARGGKVTSG